MTTPYRTPPPPPPRPPWWLRARRAARRARPYVIGTAISIGAASVAAAVAWRYVSRPVMVYRPHGDPVAVIRASIQLYENDHPNQCPTVADLRADGLLHRPRAGSDPWGRAYRIVCDDGYIGVISDGPDGVPRTDDDVRWPRRGE